MLAPAAWAAFTAGEGDGYGGPLSVLFDESPASAAKDVMRKVHLLEIVTSDDVYAACDPEQLLRVSYAATWLLHL